MPADPTRTRSKPNGLRPMTALGVAMLTVITGLATSRPLLSSVEKPKLEAGSRTAKAKVPLTIWATSAVLGELDPCG